MRVKGLLAIAMAAVTLVMFGVSPARVSAQGAAALSGVVTSAEEGKMEGVVITARKDGGIAAVSVVSDKDGKYSFPSSHLAPGTYSLKIRAVGFDLTNGAPVTVAAGKPATADLKLAKAKDLASQLSSLEWMENMTGTPEEKDKMVHQLLSCNYCHTYQRITKTKYTEQQWMAVIDRMVKYYADGTAVSNDNRRGRAARIQEPFRVQFLEKSPNWGASPSYPRTEVAAFWAKNNNSTGKLGYELTKFQPRPKGAATKVIVTEWDMPTAGTASHDSALGPDGKLWYTDESAQLLGMFDTRTQTFKEYQMPPVDPGSVPGTRDVIVGKDGRIWVPIRKGKGDSVLAVFDPKTEKVEWAEGIQSQFIAEGPDGKIWAGWTRVDPATRKAEGTFSPMSSGIVPKGAAPYAGNAEIDSKGNPWMLTQIGPGGLMGYDVAAKKAVWWPIDNPPAAGRRGAIDHQDRLWYGEYRNDKVIMVDSRTGKFQRWDLPKFTGPYTSSHPDAKGRVYAPSNMAERLYRIEPKTNTIIAYQWPTEFDTKKINWQDGTKNPTMWFVNMRTARVSRVEVLD